MKIIVIGTRGIPDYLGGVETHCQELYPRLAKLGCDVTVVRRSAYKNAEDHAQEYRGVKLVDVFSPRKKSLEAIIHTAFALIYARTKSPDLVHIHAVGPSLLTPFARLLGLKVVSTNHGPDYDRQKWGMLAKQMLRMGESLGAMFSNRVIAISPVIQEILQKKYNRDSELVFNGITHKKPVEDSSYLASLGIKRNSYVVAVGRFVEEKGFHDLIRAFSRLQQGGIKLVLVGDSDHEDDYSRALKKSAEEAGVVLTGFISGDRLVEVFCNARLFVMPSYHEGLPIALLEAMSFSLPVLVSDIPANKAVCLPVADYFPVGDVDSLENALSTKLVQRDEPDYSVYMDRYDWDLVAEQTYEVYREVVL